MRWCAILERLEHVAETQLGFAWRNLQNLFENGFLKFRLVNTNGSAAQFHAVDDYIVVLTSNFFGIGFEYRNVFSNRSGKGMVRRIPAVLLFIKTQQWKVHHPEKLEAIRRYVELSLCPQCFGGVEPDFSNNLTSVQPLVGG